LRRQRQGAVDLMTFQFDRHGGGFVIEIGRCRPEGYRRGTELVPAERMTPSHLRWDMRVRVGAKPGGGFWFRYDRPGDTFEGTAALVLAHLPGLNALYDALDLPEAPA